MITQEYKQGKHTIKIETAETLEDAKKNNFKDGVYTRCYINGKVTDNYMAMMRFIVDNVKENKDKLIPTGPDLKRQRDKMLETQKQTMIDQIENLKKEYGKMSVPKEVLSQLDGIIDKINPIGIRTVK